MWRWICQNASLSSPLSRVSPKCLPLSIYTASRSQPPPDDQCCLPMLSVDIYPLLGAGPHRMMRCCISACACPGDLGVANVWARSRTDNASKEQVFGEHIACAVRRQRCGTRVIHLHTPRSISPREILWAISLLGANNSGDDLESLFSTKTRRHWVCHVPVMFLFPLPDRNSRYERWAFCPRLDESIDSISRRNTVVLKHHKYNTCALLYLK